VTPKSLRLAAEFPVPSPRSGITIPADGIRLCVREGGDLRRLGFDGRTVFGAAPCAGAPAVDESGISYVWSWDEEDGGVSAIAADGVRLWRTETPLVWSARDTALLADGSVLAASTGAAALDRSGRLLWESEIPTDNGLDRPAVSDDGLLLSETGFSRLFGAWRGDGGVEWLSDVAGGGSSFLGQSLLEDDGRSDVVLVTLNIPFPTAYTILRLTKDGALRPGIEGGYAMALGRDGWGYALVRATAPERSELRAYDSEDRQRWSVPLANCPYDLNPDADGSIFLGVEAWCGNPEADAAAAFDANGRKFWSIPWDGVHGVFGALAPIPALGRLFVPISTEAGLRMRIYVAAPEPPVAKPGEPARE
jgi:hypothetical protein